MLANDLFIVILTQPTHLASCEGWALDGETGRFGVFNGGWHCRLSAGCVGSWREHEEGSSSLSCSFDCSRGPGG